MSKHTSTAAAPVSTPRRLAAFVGALALAGCLGAAGCTTASNDAAQTSGADTQATSEAAASISAQVTLTDAHDEDATEVIFDGEVTLDEGASVLDALEATGVEAEVVDSEYGPYVTSINGLENGAYGDSSGWTYTVNGEYGTTSADACILADGDEVAWSFLVF
jgi:hypothetical protein